MTESKNHLPLKSEVELTEEAHTCFAIPCENPECELTVLWVVEPEYDLRVGHKHAVPKEICFARDRNALRKLPPSHSMREVGTDLYFLSYKEEWISICPCGHVNSHRVDENGGMVLVSVGDFDTKRKVRIPVSHESFITTPQPDWDVAE